MQKKCAYCGKIIEQVYGSQKYCSAECQRAAMNEKKAAKKTPASR